MKRKMRIFPPFGGVGLEQRTQDGVGKEHDDRNKGRGQR